MDTYAFLNCLSFQDISEETSEHKKESLKKFSSQLLSMANRHECYNTLWKICCDLNDSELLRNLMVSVLCFKLLV